MQVDLAPALTALRRAVPGLVGVYLFGSGAHGGLRIDSDIDLAVHAGRPIEPTVLHKTREELAGLLRREVDLIDLSIADTILQMQVLREGALIKEFNAKAVGLFELSVLRDYDDLKRRRASIEADIVKRGRVYA